MDQVDPTSLRRDANGQPDPDRFHFELPGRPWEALAMLAVGASGILLSFGLVFWLFDGAPWSGVAIGAGMVGIGAVSNRNTIAPMLAVRTWIIVDHQKTLFMRGWSFPVEFRHDESLGLLSKENMLLVSSGSRGLLIRTSAEGPLVQSMIADIYRYRHRLALMRAEHRP